MTLAERRVDTRPIAVICDPWDREGRLWLAAWRDAAAKVSLQIQETNPKRTDPKYLALSLSRGYYSIVAADVTSCDPERLDSLKAWMSHLTSRDFIMVARVRRNHLEDEVTALALGADHVLRFA